MQRFATNISGLTLAQYEGLKDKDMEQRKCSCCGEPYTDESGHDLDTCIATCQTQLHQREKDHANARDDLERAYERKLAQLKSQLGVKE